MDTKILPEDIISKLGAEVIVTYRHVHGGIAKRRGIVAIDNNWFYLYDSGKTGNNYNAAFKLYPEKEYEKILSIDRV